MAVRCVVSSSHARLLVEMAMHIQVLASLSPGVLKGGASGVWFQRRTGSVLHQMSHRGSVVSCFGYCSLTGFMLLVQGSHMVREAFQRFEATWEQ